jgi:hypothetical protein
VYTQAPSSPPLPNQRVIMLIQQRGVSFSLKEFLAQTDIPFADWVKGLGGNEGIIAALRSAKVFPNDVGASERHARIAEGDFAQRLKQDPHNHAARVALALAAGCQLLPTCSFTKASASW